jgi:hypothetical protein
VRNIRGFGGILGVNPKAFDPVIDVFEVPGHHHGAMVPIKEGESAVQVRLNGI